MDWLTITGTDRLQGGVLAMTDLGTIRPVRVRNVQLRGYATLWRDRALPSLQMRTMASDLQRPALPNDVPNAKHHSIALRAPPGGLGGDEISSARIAVQGTLDV